MSIGNTTPSAGELADGATVVSLSHESNTGSLDMYGRNSTECVP